MRVSLALGPSSVLGVAALLAACSGAHDPLGGSRDSGTDGATASSSSGSSGSSGGGSGSGSGGSSGGSSGSGSGSSSGGGSGSSSGGGSGSSSGSGGCPPCDPGNINLPGNACDLDCSGTANPPGPCDASLAAAGPASDFAKALGICQMATGGSWGLVSATYTQGYNSTTTPNAGQHGILPAFGTGLLPREGSNLGVLSSGYAMVCDDPSPTAVCTATGMSDPYFKGAQTAMNAADGVPPPGYPKSSSVCATPPSPTIFDTIGVTLQIQVPKNVSGLSFDFDFYSSEWPEYACSTYNDQFVAWLQSEAWLGNVGDLNLAFDTAGNVISVNTPFIQQCTPGTTLGCDGTAAAATSTCTAGPTALDGTGFYNLGTYCTTESTGGASTGWLTTTAPVKGGETITLQLIVWDTGDANWDSSVLVDNLRWYAAPQVVKTTPSP